MREENSESGTQPGMLFPDGYAPAKCRGGLQVAAFVLVHGAWHGGWCWAKVEDALRDRGHRTYAPTLTGLGERSHLLTPEITPDLHVLDVTNVLHWAELRDAILVGHSYGGLIVTGVAGQVPERVKALVYLDAFVPEESGVSLFARGNPERMARIQAEVDKGAAGIQPDLFGAWAEDGEIRDWLKAMCTPQPAGTFATGVTLTGREVEVAHRYYILCERNRPSAFWEEHDRVKGQTGWKSDRIATMHDAMVEAPDELARLLDEFARGLGENAQGQSRGQPHRHRPGTGTAC